MRHVPLARCPRPVTAVLALVVSLGGCGWVDSTGRQSDEGPDPVLIMFDQVAPGEALVLNEESAVRLDLDRLARPGDVYAWSEAPVAAGALDSCAGVPGFRPELAAATLEEACSADADSCAFDFVRDPPAFTDDAGGDDAGGDESGADGASVGFVIVAPTLRASIGLRHELTVTTAGGASGTSAHDFCLVAINEAPFALDDGPYVVTEGTTLVVEADTPDSLLANDGDDDDVGNADALRVDTTPVLPPSASDAFELRADGGFSYSFPDAGLRVGITDSFDYVVTDGEFTSAPATVSLTIVPLDLPPVLALPLDPLEARVGEPFAVDLGAGFTDPEGGGLTFSLTSDSLPGSGSLTLSDDGFLSGEPLAEDVGDYDIRFVASDGVRETEARVSLAIVEPPNEPPVYVPGSIGDIVLLRGRPMTPQAPEFVDPEGEPLGYELLGDLPPGIEFDPLTGTLSGRPTRVGDFTGLRIVAIDPAGASRTSIVFSIQVVGRII